MSAEEEPNDSLGRLGQLVRDTWRVPTRCESRCALDVSDKNVHVRRLRTSASVNKEFKEEFDGAEETEDI